MLSAFTPQTKEPSWLALTDAKMAVGVVPKVLPQHATVPSVLTPHANRLPALTDVNWG